MTLVLKRRPSTDGATLGELFVNGIRECFTLEDQRRHGPKIAHETAIPPGNYRVDITSSVRFGRMLPILLEVPGFTGIRIHPGNTDQDTSGCILVGQGAAVDSITGSRLAMAHLQPQIASALARGEHVRIEIQDPVAPGRETLRA